MQIGDRITIQFDSAVHTDRLEEGHIIALDDDIISMRTLRTGGPIFHLHPDMSVEFQSDNLRHIRHPNFGENGRII